MSSRALSSQFDAYRQGRCDFDSLRSSLLHPFDQEPALPGHLLHGLDQAQHECPIPVTDFLLLRREVEQALKRGGPRTADEATRLAPADLTLVAPPEATRTLPIRGHDPSLHTERSDHAGCHEAATSFDPHRQPAATDSATPPRRWPRRSRFAAALLLLGAGLASLLLVVERPSRQTTPASTAITQVNRILEDAPAGSIGLPARGAPQHSLPTTPHPLPDLTTLDAPALLELLRQRLEQAPLLPATAPAGAHAVLDELGRRFPDSTDNRQARALLKEAHLHQAETARMQGQWEAAQQHLDAAFELVQPVPTAPPAGS